MLCTPLFIGCRSVLTFSSLGEKMTQQMKGKLCCVSMQIGVQVPLTHGNAAQLWTW